VDTPFDLAVTDRLLSTTRAVRRRLDLSRPVEREVVLDCIRLSQQAPTGSNSQGWRWLVVEDAGKRSALARLYEAGAAEYLGQAREQVSEDDRQTRRVYDSAVWLMQHLAEVPLHVIPCIEGRLPEGTLHLSREREAAALLGVPDGVSQVALLPVAYTRGVDFSAASRPPPQDIAFWDEWGRGG
jgi:nitroreductase